MSGERGQVTRLQNSVKNSIKTRAVRLVAATLAAMMMAGVTAVPAIALEEGRLDRPQAIKRAHYWAKRGVPYSQTGWNGGYRRDCSGLVSYAWDLPENITTWRIPLVAKKIGKNSLMQGDVLLNARGGAGGRHVVIFEKWANKQKTAYIGIEQTGASGIDKTVRRKLPYPYKFDKGLYKPYRYVGMAKYYEKLPKGQRQPVKGYKGRVVTPQAVAAAKKAEAAAKKAAEAKAAEIAKIEAVKKAAEAEAAKKAAAERVAAEKAQALAREDAREAAEQARLKEALGSPVAAMRFVARESARAFVGALVPSAMSDPAAK